MTTEAEERVDTAEEAAFRARAREWLGANVPRRQQRQEGEVAAAGQRNARAEGDMVARAKEFQAKLYDAGFAGITWPKDYGGQGLSNRYQQIFNEEAAGFEMPQGVFTIGLGMCLPTVLEHGTEEQKHRYVAKGLRGDEVWCQLFSEPGAGSDVASLQTRAVRDGDEFVVNGQKVWTSGAHYCDYGILIARTDPDQPKHRGITMFIVDMKAPGVTVKPLRQITGGSNFNEVFFDDVRIAADHMVGDYNDGWRCSITTLMNERVAIGAGGGGGGGRSGGVAALIRAAKDNGVSGDPVIRQQLADLYVKTTILGYIGMRIRAAVKTGRAPGPEGSIAKLYGAVLSRQSADVGMAIAGAAGQAWDTDDATGDRWAMSAISAPSSAIAGGTNEIQRNIIGERVLGLPKEPQVDRDMPFKEIKVGTQRS